LPPAPARRCRDKGSGGASRANERRATERRHVSGRG
jgi:hypothetical protein